MYGLALPKPGPKTQVKPKPKPPATPGKRHANSSSAPGIDATQVHDMSEDDNDSDDLFDDADAEKRKFLDEGFAADKVPIDDLKAPCLARCSDPNLIGYILRARTRTTLIHILSNLCEGGVYTYMPEAQAQAVKFRPAALHDGMSIVKVRSVCKGTNEAALIVNQTENMAPTFPVPAYAPNMGIEMSLGECFGTPAAVEQFLKHNTSPNKRAKH